MIAVYAGVQRERRRRANAKHFYAQNGHRDGTHLLCEGWGLGRFRARAIKEG